MVEPNKCEDEENNVHALQFQKLSELNYEENMTYQIAEYLRMGVDCQKFSWIKPLGKGA